MKALERHDAKMQELKREIYLAKGYRRKDLIRQFNRMEKERNEYLHHTQKRQNKLWNVISL